MSQKNMLKTIKSFCTTHQIPLPTLIVVSKYRTSDEIKSFTKNAQNCPFPTLFGENYVQEAQQKAKKGAYQDQKVALIGYLQSNKAKEAAALFDEIHSVHSIKLVEKLNNACQTLHKNLPIMIQVNIGAESQKNGCPVQDLPALILYIKDNCKNLSLTGLMAIPPAQQDPSPYFKDLATLTKQYNLPYTSMGMSGDWQTALNLGATHIRLGTALFGERPQKK